MSRLGLVDAYLVVDLDDFSIAQRRFLTQSGRGASDFIISTAVSAIRQPTARRSLPYCPSMRLC